MAGFLDSDLGKVIALQYALGGYRKGFDKTHKAKQDSVESLAKLKDRKKFFADKRREFDVQDKKTSDAIKHARKLIGNIDE